MPFGSFLLSKDLESVQVLTRVLNDLEISVETCNQAFVAAKRLMEQRFDVVIIDCDDELGAGWVLQSARMAAPNKDSVTVAVVRNHPGAQSALKMGENFVIHKPILVKQAENTFKAVRSLLNRVTGSPGTGSKPTAAHVPVSHTFTAHKGAPSIPAQTVIDGAHETKATSRAYPASQSFGAPTDTHAHSEKVRSSQLPPSSSTVNNATQETLLKLANDLDLDTTSQDSPKNVQPWPEIPASERHLPETLLEPREIQPDTSPANRDAWPPQVARTSFGSSNATQVEPLRQALGISPGRKAIRRPSPADDVPSFAAEEETRSSVPRTTLVAMIVVIVLVGGMYAWRRFRSHEARQAVQQVAPAPTPVASNQPAAEPAPAPPPAVTSSDSQTAVETDSSEKQSKPEHKTKSPPPESRTSKSKQSESEVSTRVLANNLESPAPAEPTAVTSEPEPEPPVTPPALEAVADQGHSGIAPVVTSVPVSMPGIAPKRLVVSQGVSQGMLLKQVKPSYPPLARERHLEGAVILKAVIGRNGAVHDLKAISGPAVLAHSAISAVKQWQYRPYMLNGQPVEVETFITVNFKL